MQARRRGIALITALWLTVFLLILGLAFMSFIEQDYRFSGKQERMSRAYYLALGGVQYYRLHTSEFVQDVWLTRNLPPTDARSRFSVRVLADGTVESRGQLLNGLGGVATERFVVVPQGQMDRLDDMSQ